jgi:peptide/nickel transport system substrate-binding protein
MIFTGTEPAPVANGLLANQADWGQPVQELVEQFRRDTRFNLQQIFAEQKQAVVFNVQKDPYKDGRVRDAISIAIDRRLMITNLYAGLADICGYVNPGREFWAISKDELQTFKGYRKDDPNLTEAKQLLTAAGYADGFEDTIINAATSNADKAMLIIPMVAKLGIKVNQSSVGPAIPALIARLNPGDFTLANGAFGAAPEPDNEITVFHQSTGSRNYSKYSDKSLDDMLSKARQEFDNQKRKALYLDIQRYLLKGQTPNFAWHNAPINTQAIRTYVKMPQPAPSHGYLGMRMAEDLYLEGKT